MSEETQTLLKEIKQSFRLFMNGVTARSMNEKGADYKINWGVSIPDLQKMAEQYGARCEVRGARYDLAIELWKENIRECKILATMIMPPELMPEDVAEIWMEQTHSQEMAEIAAFYLYQHLDYAPGLAYRWMSSDDVPRLIASYQIMARLFARGIKPNVRGINEYIDQVYISLQHESLGVRRAAQNSVMRFAEMGEDYAKIARSALNYDFL